MSKEFRFPDLGEGIAEGELIKWLVKVGDTVNEDQDVAEVETDKALVSIPSPVSGKVEKLHYQEGDKIKVGSVLITFEGESPASKKEETKESKTKEEVKEPKTQQQAISSEQRVTSNEQPAASNEKQDTSPLATPHLRKMARELKVNLEEVHGSGPKGRITEEDLHLFVQKKSETVPSKKVSSSELTKDFEKYGPIERVLLKGVRRKISEHMLLTSQQTVMVTHIDEVEVDALTKVKEEMRKDSPPNVKLTLLPFLMKACATTLKNYPYLNASLLGDEIILKNYYHFGFAVDTEAGLIVPVIRNVEQKSILQLATELQTLSDKARNRTLTLEELKGHSFSLTNIGSIGGKAFTPIVHYPDSAILGLGRAFQKPVVREGRIEVGTVMPLCLTFDHRITDGATAARFVNEIMDRILNG